MELSFAAGLTAQQVHLHRPEAADAWSTYGSNLAGDHYSGLAQIDTHNVAKLAPAWVFHTGALAKPGVIDKLAAFEANPVIWKGMLFLDTPFDEVIALDGASGRKLWAYDPGVDRNVARSLVTSRGVALWHAAAEAEAGSAARPDCADRVYVATLDARLIAMDANDGQLCRDFGSGGMVDLKKDVAFVATDDYEMTSPVTVVGDTLVVGSSIGDNRAVTEEFGIVRGYDARSGRELWAWDPIPWARNEHPRTGAGNAWGAISADPEHGLVYVPTGSPSPDFWGGFRKGNNQDADSIVALDARSGRKVWAFQMVHHDLWDYDVAAEPTLFTYHPAHGADVPAVAVATKMGMVFVFNRLNGVPIYPIEERAVPQTTVAGEQTSPTQPFSSLAPLAPLSFTADDLQETTAEDTKYCRDALARLQYKGIYTPVATTDALIYPGPVGGVNWGSPALDERSNILYANTNSLGFVVRLLPQLTWMDKLEGHLENRWARYFGGSPSSASDGPKGRFHAPDTGGRELSVQAGAPYRIYRAPFSSPDGMPCAPMPWGRTVAMDMNTGKIVWSHALGTLVAGKTTGSPTLGGPIVTGGGLVFTAATVEPLLRALDARTGEELWQGQLPAPAQATPMTYEIDGRQYVVIAAGGHGAAGIAQSDAVMAFALPAAGKDGRSSGPPRSVPKRSR